MTFSARLDLAASVAYVKVKSSENTTASSIRTKLRSP